MNLRDELMAKCSTTGVLKNTRKKKLNIITIQNAAVRKAKEFKINFSTSGSTSFNLRGRNNTKDGVSETFGSLDDTNNSDSKVILAITQGRGDATCEVGIAAINIMSPSLIMCQISDTLSYTNILTKINILNPSEILIPMTTTSTRLTDKIKEYFKNAKIMGVPRGTFNSTNGFNYVKRVCAFNWNSIVLMVQYKYYALTAVSALLTYIENHLYTFYTPESMKVEYQESEGFMIIDVLTADKLELVACALPDINPKYSSLRGILNNCVTKIGSRTLRATILQPPCNLEEINSRLDCVEELVKDQGRLTSLREILSQLSKIDQLLTLATIMPDKASSCSVRQLNYILLLNTVFDLLQPLNDIFADSNHVSLVELRTTLAHNDFNYLKNIVRTVIHENARPAAGEQGMTERCFAIKPDVNPILDIIRKRYSERLDELRDYVRKLGMEHNLDLKLSNNSKKGYHIILKLSKQEIKTFKLSSLPEIFIHVERTITMVTMTTIEIQTFQIRLEDISTEIVKLSNVILYKLLLEIHKHIGLFYKLCEQIAKVDMMQSLALSSSSVDKYVRPKFNCFTEVINGRHPLLEYLSDNDPTGNDIFVSPEFNMNIVTGPNSSGKSIYIRQIALLQIMAQIGCFVPASSATFRVTDRLLARIYLEDDMYCGASTFTLEMKEIKYFLNVMTPNTLIIIDELCRSTSVLEGTGLAMAICEKLLQTPAFIFFTTHYTFITRLYDMYYNVQCWQLETEDIQNKIVYTHKIVPGVTKLEDYAIYSARACWPSDVMRDVEAIKKYIEVKQVNASVFCIEPRMRLKYNIEADLRILKYKGLCTKDTVRERMIMYQQDLNKIGIKIDWENNLETIRSNESEMLNLDLSFQQIIQPEAIYNNSESLHLNENDFPYLQPKFSSNDNDGIENQDTFQYLDVNNQSIDDHVRQQLINEIGQQHEDPFIRQSDIDQHAREDFVDDLIGQNYIGELNKQGFVGQIIMDDRNEPNITRQNVHDKNDKMNWDGEYYGRKLSYIHAEQNNNGKQPGQRFVQPAVSQRASKSVPGKAFLDKYSGHQFMNIPKKPCMSSQNEREEYLSQHMHSAPQAPNSQYQHTLEQNQELVQQQDSEPAGFKRLLQGQANPKKPTLEKEYPIPTCFTPEVIVNQHDEFSSEEETDFHAGKDNRNWGFADQERPRQLVAYANSSHHESDQSSFENAKSINEFSREEEFVGVEVVVKEWSTEVSKNPNILPQNVNYFTNQDQDILRKQQADNFVNPCSNNLPTQGQLFSEHSVNQNYSKNQEQHFEIYNYQKILSEISNNQKCVDKSPQNEDYYRGNRDFQLTDSSQDFEDVNETLQKTSSEYEDASEHNYGLKQNRLLDSNQNKNVGGNLSTIDNSSFTTVNEFQFVMPLRKNNNKTSTPLIRLRNNTPKFFPSTNLLEKQTSQINNQTAFNSNIAENQHVIELNNSEKQSVIDTNLVCENQSGNHLNASEKQSTHDSISEAELSETMEYLESSGYLFEDEFPEVKKMKKCEEINESISYSPDYELIKRYKENQKIINNLDILEKESENRDKPNSPPRTQTFTSTGKRKTKSNQISQVNLESQSKRNVVQNPELNRNSSFQQENNSKNYVSSEELRSKSLNALEFFSKSEKSSSLLNNMNSNSNSRSIPNVQSNIASTVSVSNTSSESSEKVTSYRAKSNTNSNEKKSQLNLSKNKIGRTFYDKESVNENVGSSSGQVFVEENSNSNSRSVTVAFSSDEKLKFTSDEKLKFSSDEKSKLTSCGKERSFIKNLKSFDDFNKSISHISSETDSHYHTASENNFNVNITKEKEISLNESSRSLKFFENSKESFRSSLKARKPSAKPINKMTKREIEQLYHERDLKYLNSTGDQCFKYSEEILNRPKAKQLKASKQVAVARKSEDGSVVVICDQKFQKQKRIMNVKQPLRHNVGRKFDVTIFSDENSRVFDEFMQTEEDPKRDSVFFDKCFQKETETSASNLVSADTEGDFFSSRAPVFQFTEGNSIDEIVKKYL